MKWEYDRLQRLLKSFQTPSNPPIRITLPATGRIIINGNRVGLEGVAPKIRNAFSSNAPPSVIVQVEKGAKAGLATQVMDQALVAGAKAVKLAEIRKMKQESSSEWIGYRIRDKR